jgi:hypothetical protein
MSSIEPKFETMSIEQLLGTKKELSDLKKKRYKEFIQPIKLKYIKTLEDEYIKPAKLQYIKPVHDEHIKPLTTVLSQITTEIKKRNKWWLFELDGKKYGPYTKIQLLALFKPVSPPALVI